MIDQEKINAVREYLRTEFPNSTISDEYDFGHDAQIFWITEQESKYVTAVSEEFFLEHEATDIPTRLQEYRLGEQLHKVGPARVLVTTTGLEPQKE